MPTKSHSRALSRFDRLLYAMATQPEPSGKPAKGNRTSAKAPGVGYGDTRTREAKVTRMSGAKIWD
jgi:hypothetical protein